MNINEIINQKVSEVIASDTLAKSIGEKVEKHINDVIDESLKDVFGYNGNGRRQIKKIIQSKIVLPTYEEISLPAYNEIISEMIKQKLNGIMNDTLIKKVNEELENFIKPQGSIVKFSEIIKKFKDYVVGELDQNELDFDDGTAYAECTIIAEKSRYGARWFNLDKEEGEDKYGCKYQFALSLDSKKNHIYGVRIKDVDYKKDLILGNLNRFEAFLINLYLTETEIEIDIDLDDIDNEIEIEYEY